jgi:hypothetical protein
MICISSPCQTPPSIYDVGSKARRGAHSERFHIYLPRSAPAQRQLNNQAVFLAEAQLMVMEKKGSHSHPWKLSSTSVKSAAMNYLGRELQYCIHLDDDNT